MDEVRKPINSMCYTPSSEPEYNLPKSTTLRFCALVKIDFQMWSPLLCMADTTQMCWCLIHVIKLMLGSYNEFKSNSQSLKTKHATMGTASFNVYLWNEVGAALVRSCRDLYDSTNLLISSQAACIVRQLYGHTNLHSLTFTSTEYELWPAL
jgi:hypothetical protein